MKAIKTILFVMIPSILFFSCATLNVWTDYDEEIDFNEYRTFKIQYHDESVDFGVNPVQLIRIKNAIYLELLDMGYLPDDNPDFLVTYKVKNESNQFLDYCQIQYSDMLHGGVCINRIVNYEEGTLIIDFIDPFLGAVAWHGSVSGPNLNKVQNPDRFFRKMVSKMFQQIPKSRNPKYMTKSNQY